MRFLFIIGTIVVLACSIWVSFNHTLELFMEGGYRGGLQWGITIAAETAFLMGVLSRFKSRLKGTKPHGPATFMFLLGLGVVGWSNWNAGMAYGAQGVIKGILVPFFIYGAEAVLAREYMEWRKEKEGISDDSETVSQKAVETISGIIGRIISAKTVSNNHTISNGSISLMENKTVSEQTISNETVRNETVNEKSISLMDRESRKETNNISISKQSVSLTENETISEQTVNETTVSKKTISNETVSKQTVNDKIVSEKSVINENVSLMNDKTISEENVSEQTISNDQQTKRSNVVELSSKKRISRKRKVTPEEIERVKDIARRLLQENPSAGRYTLVKEAGCSHHVAQLVLDELKQSS